MEEEENQVSDWLEKLQRESWNLELLVSGFSIFLLIQAYQELISALRYFNLHTAFNGNVNGMVVTFLGILILGSLILTFNLIAHVFLRGFWIGTVGLRSVQNKIDLEKLNYSNYFTQKLKERVPSLDNMLERLDTLSSVIFSFTFLILFMFFSLFLYFSALSVFIYFFDKGLNLIEEDSLFESIFNFVGIGMVLFMLFVGIIYMIDTLTLGFFKRFERFSKIYFPIYRVIGMITMAGIYRSIYYSLISRFSKNKIRVALFVYLMLFFIIPFIKYDQYIYYPDNGNAFKISSNEYDDLRDNKLYIGDASIPSQIIKKSFLPLFIRYDVNDNRVLKKICPDFEPKKMDGFNSGIKIQDGGLHLGDARVDEDNPGKALECLANYFSIKIDSIAIQPDFYFHIHPNHRERGVQTMLEIGTLSKGKHDIYIYRKRLGKEDEIIEKQYSHIVFWKE